MKERPYIYVVIDECRGDTVAAAFYEKSSAVEWCQERLAEQLLDARDWNRYFRISGIQCN